MGRVQATGAVSIGSGQGWAQAIDLVLAVGLSSLIGLEREFRQKSAGLRTQTVVGLGAALFTLVGRYGFTGGAPVDESRVAAQIVTGIGFIGGGLIFVRRDAVQGLTTAATVWLTAGVGMACGASLPVLAGLATGVYFIVAFVYRDLTFRLPRSRSALSRLRLTYVEGSGALRRALVVCTEHGFTVSGVHIERERRGTVSTGAEHDHRRGHAREEAEHPDALAVSVLLEVTGREHIAELAAALAELDGVLGVTGGDANVPQD